jgi:phage FluMu protein Com
MGKAYCPKCKKTLNEVFSSFECLATWDKAEKFYTPGDNCNLVRRCTKCGTLTKEQKKDYSLLNKPPQLQRSER